MDSLTCGPKYKGWGAVFGIPALFVLAYFYASIPVVAGMETCAVKHFLSFPCPGCGLTHSFIALAHFDIRGSIDAHPLGVVIAIWLVYMFVRAVGEAVTGRRVREVLTQGQRDVLLFAFLGAMMVQWGVRLAVLHFGGN